MKNRICALCVLALLFSCKEKVEPVIITPVKQEQPTQPKAKLNPAILQNGSSFLQTFSAYWKLGQWQELINMTDQKSVRQYGIEALEKKYRKMNLAMRFDLKSMVDNKDSTYTLNYSTTEFATKKMFRVRVKINSDNSVKLIVSDIKTLFQ